MISGPRPDDTRLTALIGELSIKSAEFRQIWARYPVKEKTNGTKVLDHPLVGRLEMSYDRMLLPDQDAAMYVYTAEPGTETAERLVLLARPPSLVPIACARRRAASGTAGRR